MLGIVERTVDKSEGRNRGRSMPGFEEMMLVAYSPSCYVFLLEIFKDFMIHASLSLF